jgi:hypothetical protein
MLKSEYGFATGFDAAFSKPTTEQPARAALEIVGATDTADVSRHLGFFLAAGRGFVLDERPVDGLAYTKMRCYAGWVPLNANGPMRIASVASIAPAFAASGGYELRGSQ